MRLEGREDRAERLEVDAVAPDHADVVVEDFVALVVGFRAEFRA